MMGFEGFGLLSNAGLVWLVIDWALRLLALFIVPRNRKPTAGMAWLMMIFFFPTLGWLIFLIIGNPKLPKARREVQKTLDGIIGRSIARLEKEHPTNNFLRVDLPERQRQVAKLNQLLGGLPVVSGNSVEVLPEYDEIIARIVDDIDGAERFVHIEYFIIVLDEAMEPLFAALGRAVERGVTVRVMYDSFSTKRYKTFKAMLRRFDADGVIHHPMLPFKLPGKGYIRPDLRNHRKLVVVDGHTGYTGSQNLVQRNYHRKDDIYYDELVVRAQGPVVLELSAIFLTDWFSETGELLQHKKLGVIASDFARYGDVRAQVLPSGPGYEEENNLMLFTSLIHTAQKRITIVNPYFVPDDALTTAITSATRRGVEVTMINSEAMDQWMVGHAQRSFYEAMLKAGVDIYLYKAPTLLHSKFITIDDDLATIGSSNFDIRSFFLDLEVTLVAYDASVVRALRKVEAQYLGRSTRLSYEQWQQRPRHLVLVDNIARLTSSLQ